MLNVDLLKSMNSGEIFSCGTFKDNHIGINFNGSDLLLRWVAVRGEGYHDWCIYVGSLSDSESYIKDHGDKLMGESSIKRLVLCDDDSFKLYRY